MIIIALKLAAIFLILSNIQGLAALGDSGKWFKDPCFLGSCEIGSGSGIVILRSSSVIQKGKNWKDLLKGVKSKLKVDCLVFV